MYTLTQKLKLSWYDFSRKFTSTIQDKKFQGKFKDIYVGFCKESEEELFDSEEEAIEFYSKQENYKSLITGDIGENLIAKYTAKSLFALDDILTVIFYVIRNNFKKTTNKELNSVLNSSEKWLKNLYLLDVVFADKEIFGKSSKFELKMDFDFPGWLSKVDSPFKDFNKEATYKLDYDIQKVKDLRNEIQSLFKYQKSNYDGASKFDKERAFGRFLMRRERSTIDAVKRNFERLN